MFKKIELSEKDKRFIEKAAMKLFPKYAHNKKTGYGGICFHHNNHWDLRLFGFRYDGYNGDKFDDAEIGIHWFEFCVKYLIKEIYKENDRKNKNRQKGIEYDTLILNFITCDKPVELLKFWYRIIIENKNPWKEVKY